MTDERVDALIRRLDVGSNPDPEFVTATAAMLRPLVRAARNQDASRIGRLRRDLRLSVALLTRPPLPQRLAITVLVVLLLLAAVAAAIVMSGAFHRSVPFGNGPLIITVGGQLRAVDTDTGVSRPIGPSSENAKHVSRSPDGRLIAYWKVDPGGEALTFIGSDGEDRHRVSTDEPVVWGGCIDTWSSDSRYLATEVTVGGSNRILLADSATGTGRLVTPAGVVAHCPLWSPDGQWIAFTQEPASGPSILAVIRPDGTDMHGISGDIGGATVGGPNTWSPNGTWLYFTTGGSDGTNWRVNVALQKSTRLSSQPGFATAVASSPDDRFISFIVPTSIGVGWDLYVANSDGTNQHRVLTDAMNLGWSADSRYVLTWWRPSDGKGGVALVSPDGTETRVVVPPDQACIDADRICDVGWGQARP